MQEKKNIRLALSLVLLIVLTVVAYWYTGTAHHTIDKSIFKTEDLKTISRIVLEHNGEKTALRFNGTAWTVNEKYDADRRMIQLIFATLLQAEPRRAIGASERDSIGKALEATGVKVSLYAGDVLDNSFYAGGNNVKTQAFFKKAGDRDVYAMVIPGYRDYVSGIFELPEGGWRDKYVFKFNWRNFKSLITRFPSHPEEDFTASLQKDFFTIANMPKVDTAKLNTYLDDVSLLVASRFETRGPLLDSLRALVPVVEIDVQETGRTYTLKIYQPGKQATVPAVLNDTDVVYFDKRRAGSILKPRSYFLLK